MRLPALPPALKDAAEDAFHNNSLLSLISPEDREVAAQWYEDQAGQMVGAYAELARLYNLERAKFLRGQVGRIADNAHGFRQEINYPKWKGRD